MISRKRFHNPHLSDLHLHGADGAWCVVLTRLGEKAYSIMEKSGDRHLNINGYILLLNDPFTCMNLRTTHLALFK